MARDIDQSGEFVWRDVRGGLARKNGGAWVETPIPEYPAWFAACLFFRVGDSATLAEFRILPDAGRTVWSEDVGIARGEGEWSRRSQDMTSDHTGGLTSRMVRKVPLDAIFKEALRRVNEFQLVPKGWDALARNAPGRPGRAGRDDHFYAVWAKRYADQATRSKSPTKDIADKWGKRYGAVAQWIYDARDLEILSRSGSSQQGKSGGVLTAKGLAILREGKR